MSNDTNPQRNPDEEQRRYYDRYLADEMRASGVDPSDGEGSGSSSRMPLLVGGGIAAVLLVGGGVFLAVHNSGDSGKQAGGSSGSVSSTSGGPSSTSGAPTSGGGSSSTPTSSTGRESVAAVISGWKSVVGNSDYPVVYDVPQNWQIPDVTHGYGFVKDHPDQRAVGGHDAAWVGRGFCASKPDDTRAFVTVVDAGQRDVGEAGPAILNDAVDLVSRNKDGNGDAQSKSHGSKTIKLRDGTPAVDTSATANSGKGRVNNCIPSQVDLRTVTFTNADGHTFCVFIERDVVSQAPSPDVINKIASSVRPLK